MSRVAVLLLLVLARAAALDAPLGVVAVPAKPGGGEAQGGTAVIIAPDRALTLAEALPEGVEPTLRIAGVLIQATVLKRGPTTTAVLLGFTPPAGARLPPIAMADSTSLHLGDQVVSVGNSFGILEQDAAPALSQGIVSGLYALPADSPPVRGRGGRVLSTYRGPVIEVDAAVNDGNQGGALLDRQGRLVGLVSLALARERRLGTAVPIRLICAELGLETPTALPGGPADANTEALISHAARVASSVALVYFERPAGLGNPAGMPRPAPITGATPAYQRQRLEQDWDRYWHQQQVFYTDQPVTALVLDREHLLTAASNLHGDGERGRVLIDGGSIDCTVLAVHASLDLAVLKTASPLPLPAAELAGQIDLQCGDPLVVIGRHRQNISHTVTVGVVSAIDRRLSQSEFAFHQTDAMANYGNLGGPVVDLAGAVVGLMVMLGPSGDRPWLINSGVALFVDSTTLQQVLPGLLAGQAVTSMRTLGLGVVIAPGAERERLAITKVVPGTGAAEAGLRAGDVISMIAGRPVESLEAVSRVLVRHRAGERIAVTVLRDGVELTLQVELRAFSGEAQP